MDAQKNFLLGYGEKLTNPVPISFGGGPKRHPYTADEAKIRIRKQLIETIEKIDHIPSKACPNDEVVAIMTLHPAYLAKSYYPSSLLRCVNLEAVGSKAVTIQPEKFLSTKHKSALSAAFYVAGQRKAFHKWVDEIMDWKEQSVIDDLKELERIESFSIDAKVKNIDKGKKIEKLEVVLQAPFINLDGYILKSFNEYVSDLGGKVEMKRRKYVGGLCFIPVIASELQASNIATFSYVRVVRGMPQLRPITPPFLRVSSPPLNCILPKSDVLDTNIKVAIFDGGLTPDNTLQKWAKQDTTSGIGAPIDEFQKHGHMVTSALLFGSCTPNARLPQPFSNVTHFRVLDTETGKKDDLYDVLSRIEEILNRDEYEFVNISLGPDLPIDDDDVHVWTAVLDQIFARGNVLAAIAGGNSGERDDSIGLNRIQPPADCVNALSVGACDSIEKDWKHAPYSSVGPGRGSGFVKPDGLAFGGTPDNPFYVLSPNASGVLQATCGTSFASPFALRSAIGVRALLGDVLNPLALKALLVHRTHEGTETQEKVGWGRFEWNIDRLISCFDHEATVVYKGWLTPGKYLRARIPFTQVPPEGKVSIKATFCFTTQIKGTSKYCNF